MPLTLPINELLLVIHTLIIGSAALVALKLGKEALVSYISIGALLANLFVLKQISLFGYTATCADAYYISAMLGLNLLQEYYGREVTTKAVWTSFFLMGFFALMSYIHLIYIPSMFDTSHSHFMALLEPAPRIVMASLATYFIVQQIDLRIYGTLKVLFLGNYLTLRSYISLGVSQLIDTILFSFLGLYGIVEHISDIIIVSYIIKLTVIALLTPAIYFSKKIIPTTAQKI